jgi:hypothetical protein
MGFIVICDCNVELYLASQITPHRIIRNYIGVGIGIGFENRDPDPDPE